MHYTGIKFLSGQINSFLLSNCASHSRDKYISIYIYTHTKWMNRYEWTCWPFGVSSAWEIIESRVWGNARKNQNSWWDCARLYHQSYVSDFAYASKHCPSFGTTAKFGHFWGEGVYKLLSWTGPDCFCLNKNLSTMIEKFNSLGRCSKSLNEE